MSSAQQTLLGLKEQFEEKAVYFRCCCCLLPFIIFNLLSLSSFIFLIFFFSLFSSHTQGWIVPEALSRQSEGMAPPAEVHLEPLPAGRCCPRCSLLAAAPRIHSALQGLDNALIPVSPAGIPRGNGSGAEHGRERGWGTFSGGV